MSRILTLKIFKRVVKGDVFWGMYVPARLSATGKRGVKLFSKRADAERFRLQLLAAWRETDGVPLSAAEIADMRAALRVLADNGISGFSLTEAVRAALPLLRQRGQMSCAELLEMFRSARAQGWRAKSESGFRFAARKFCEVFGERAVAGVLPAEIAVWLAGAAPSAASRANLRRTLEPAFNFAVRQEILERSPWDKVERERVERERGVDVLTVPEVLRLMEVAPEDCKAAFALLLFAGVRPQELERLVWGDVRDGFVHITARVAKTRQVRNVDVSDNLAAWLEMYRRDDEERICPPNWARKNKATRKAAGIADRQDVCRHSFASYHLARWGDAAETKLQLGHSARSDLLFVHYRAAVTKTAAEGFWRVYPAGGIRAAGTMSSRPHCVG